MAHAKPPPTPVWRCVLLSGPAGSGKTTVCRLGHHAMVAAWGHPAAAIDVDQLYANVDARWELPYDDRRNAMVLAQAAHLAISLFEHGWPTVVICGNSLFDPADTAPVVATLGPVAQIHHVTLIPDLATVLRRCATTPGRDPARVTAEVEHFARRIHPGSARLDNSNLTPQATLDEMARLIGTGAGRLR
ncbi:hypothetical protein [Streptomyces sp. 6N223]|uniref:hypothetical protein n=1 Tax=Streptomyces sp. 6N223 TaxID=3457412 RepID=UPI003FD49394